MKLAIRKWGLLALQCSIITACGGGGGGGDSDSGPSDMNSVGTVTSFGSVYVNGIKYETDSANVDFDDGLNYSPNDLQVGMLVQIVGSVNSNGITGTANTVYYDKNIQGPISALRLLDSSTIELTILQKTVIVPNEISFSNVSFSSLAVGQYVEVSGFKTTADGFQATRIKQKTDGFNDDNAIEIESVITSVDTANQSFSLQSLTVDYSQAQLTGFPDAQPAVGQIVEVKGNTIGPNGQLVALNVELDDDYNLNENDSTEIEGVVSNFVDISNFTLNSIAVNASNATIFKGVNADIQNGLRIEAEGVIDANGVLQANKIKLKKKSKIKIEAPVQAVDANANTITLLGIVVNLDDVTLLKDDSDSNMRFFSINDIAVGDWIEVKANAVGDQVIAIRIERDDENDDDDDFGDDDDINDVNEVELQGIIDTVNGTQIVILGVTVDISNFVNSDYINQLTPGTLVEVEGQLIDTAQIMANEVDIEFDYYDGD
jgi:Domain of unknown function (DUF5666)